MPFPSISLVFERDDSLQKSAKAAGAREGARTITQTFPFCIYIFFYILYIVVNTAVC